MKGPDSRDYENESEYMDDVSRWEDEADMERDRKRDEQAEEEYNENELYSLRTNILAQVVRLERQIPERLEMSASKLTPLIIMTYQAKLDVLASIGLHLPRIEEMRKALKNHN
mgnify:CR=1 FL=1